MPAAAAAAVAALFTAGSVAATVAFAVTYVVTTLAISFAVGSIMGAIFKPRSNNGFASEAQGRTQVVRSNVQPRNLIYGRAMTSGPLIFAASTDEGSAKNKYMHLVIALADHQCDAVEEVYLGEDPVGPLNSAGYPTGGKFAKKWYETHTDNVYVMGQPQVTLTTSYPVSSMMSVSAQNDEGLIQDLMDVSWEEDSRTVTVRGIHPDATTLSVTYAQQFQESKVRVKVHLGSPTQNADADLLSEVSDWTWDHRLQGVCYLYVRLQYDADLFPTGLPNIKALVRGKILYNPFYGTRYWTDNWAMCVYDYLLDERGFDCDPSEVDLDVFGASGNICDEQVPLATGGTQQRYRCNGVVMTDKSPRDNLAEMVSAGGGTVVIAGGIFKIYAGAYDIPTVTLTESDLRGSVKVRPRTSRKDLFNVVKGTFVDPANNWQPSDFPAVSNPTYAAQDGEVIERDIELPFTTNAVMAQRLAKIILERSRQGIVVEFPAKLTAFQLAAYSTVRVSLAKFGWTNKVFRVMSWKMSQDGGIDLTLNEEAAAVYDWAAGNATVTDPAPDTNLPNPFVVEMLGQISMESGESQLIVSQSGVVTSRILVTWPPVREVSLSQTGRVEMQYRRTDKSEWTALPPISGDNTSLYISPVEDAYPYQVRGRYVSALGVRSPDWTYSTVHIVVGKLAPPDNMTGLSLTVLNGFANLTWDPATNVDVSNGGQARIRHTTDIVQPSWSSAIDIGGYVSGAANSAQLPLLSGVYLAKWVDSTGHESPAAAMVITTAPSLSALNFVAAVAEHPAFSGAKTNIVRDPDLNGIKLIGAGLIDDQGLSDASGLWDSQGAIDGLGAIDQVVGSGGWGLIDSLGGVVDSGTYVFASVFDLGSVEKSRLTATIDAVSFDTGDMIDFRYDAIDTWESIDGNRISDTSVALYVRTTQDNPAGSPTWTDWQRFSMGDYEARAFQWKVVLESGSSNHNVVVTGLTVNIDMPDRRESGRDVVSSAAATAIGFGKAFRVTPGLGITAQNLSQGDYFVISGKSQSGFTITFFNSFNVPVSRKFDWDAVAY